MLALVGLNPHDTSDNLATPIGIGNTAGRSSLRHANVRA
jgi:hypothetical protein